MKRIQKFVAVSVMGALIGAGVPAMAAEHGHDAHGRAEVHAQPARSRTDRGWNNDRNRYRGNEGYVYAPAPVYRGPVYDNGYYYDQRTHNGRAAAIIGGSAAAGAVIGAAVGHGQGAVLGAVIGGIAGTVASAAANHQDRY